MKKSIVLLLAVFSFIACNQQKQNSSANLDEAKEAIAASNAIYFTSFAKNDSSIFINCYANDACIMGGNAPIKCGRDLIARFFREKYNKGYRNGKFITTAVYGDGKEYVTEEGVGLILDTTGKVRDGGQGKYLVLWKKTSDGWKMFRDSFSGDEEK